MFDQIQFCILVHPPINVQEKVISANIERDVNAFSSSLDFQKKRMNGQFPA